MPIVFPKVFEFHQLSVAIGQPHVDCAGHFLSASHLAGSTRSAPAAMPRDRATTHLVWRYTQGLSLVKISIGCVRFFGPRVHPILVEKHWSQHRLLNGRFSGEDRKSVV